MTFSDAELSAAQEEMTRHGIRKRLELWTDVAIVAGALKRGIELQPSPKRHIVLRHAGKNFRWPEGLNVPLARRATQLKEVTSRLLRSKGINAPENAVFGPEDVARALAWAAPIFPVVVKPFEANMGRGVHVNINNETSFRQAFSRVAADFGHVLVEDFAPGVEHRVLVVDYTVVAATRRVPANVVGDGEQSVAELAEIKSQDLGRIHKKIVLDDMVADYLRRRGLSIDSVPAAGEQVFLRGTSNLHTGGDAVDATEQLKPEEIEFAERAARAIPGLRLAGLDLLLPRGGQGSEPSVLEINPKPMISMHHFPREGTPRDAAGAILDVVFPSTRAQ
ncbi:ATP-grasp domain-containing protein [Nesterenkonia flava]|uniref:ATP-grasp domain-containing protein n=1 Tax=Nesterenkonia flava TaxID=469799 RepID=A0ABU1FQ45_9MICC|nr:ATP-grasp domain-containing protein [Nesterenkonia flava]MDR5710765.1 ATP-grasp domain-containing protein [Nesterenkonia flava]